MITDKLLGGLLTLASISIFSYYTIWVLVLPLLESTHFLQQYFPAHVYAIAIPATALAVGVVLVCIFVGVVMIKESNKAAAAKSKKE